MSLSGEIRALKDAIVANGGMLVGGITASAADLTITAASAKNIIMKLGANDTSKKLSIIDSDDAEVLKVDANGLITSASGLAGPVTGAVTGNVTGDVTGNVTGDVTGNLTGSVINNNVAAHSYSSGHADWTLSATEKKALILSVTLADAGANIIGPAENRVYYVRNGSGQAITIKKAGGTGITVANGKTAKVAYSNADSDYIRLTADATH